MTSRVIASCPTEACVICHAPVYTCELGECPEGEDGRHMAGGELSSGGWVCSEACDEAATAWPPRVDRRLIAHRVFGLVMVWLCVFWMFLAQPVARQQALGLSMIVTALWGLIHWALTKLPPEPRGRVTSRGRR